MSNDQVIPSAAPKSVCTFTILSNGNAISRAWQVLAIVVSKEVNRVPAATITLVDGQASQQTFAISDAAEFQPGAALDIHLGYRGTEQSVFQGVVVRHSIKIRKTVSVLNIEARDKAVKMTAYINNGYFVNVKDSDVIQQLIQNYGLTANVDDSKVTHPELVQYRCTDWDFMLCRADLNGLLCVVDDGTVQVAAPNLTQSSALTVQFGATVKDLDAEIDARLQFSGVTASAWDPAQQEMVSDDATEPQVPSAGNISATDLASLNGSNPLVLRHSGIIAEPELQAWADAQLLKQRLAKIRGSVRIDGTAAVKPGQIITLQGVGDRFKGDLFVTGVRHEMEKGLWETILQFGVSPQWFAERFNVQKPMAAAMLPAVQGLQIGVVTGLAGDPDDEQRIMVRVPVIHDQDDGTWCRIATLDAGSSRGTYFRPEVGDEVIVGFINNDPRDAIVLGQVHSSANPAPQPVTDANDLKGYASRSGMTLQFDDGKKEVMLATPGGNQIVLSDQDNKILIQDSNGNSITLDQSGVSIQSASAFQATATSDFNASGANTTLKANAQLTVQGAASAEFSSSGSTSIKGSLVQIN